MALQDVKSENFEDRFKSIELRLANLESSLVLNTQNRIPGSPEGILATESSINSESASDEEKGLESRIGRVGLAWLGNLVLLFAVIFFTEYLKTLDHKLFSVITGAFSVGVIFLISNYIRNSNPNLSFMLKINSQVALFYVALRMNFFSSDPLISDKFIVIAVLLLIITYQIYSSVKNKSQILGLIAIIFILFTGIVSDSTHIMLPLAVIAATGAIVYFLKYDWEFLLIASIILVYITFFMWLFGNPVMGKPFVILGKNEYSHLYLLALGACFSFLPLIRKKDESIDDLLVVAIIINGVFFTMLLTFISTKYFSHNYVNLFSVITVCCLVYSVVLKSVSDWKFAPAFYALYGFLAMSISLYGLVGLPEVYLLLSVQSLIVVAMALWFRNRLMIIMNSLLFLAILLVYQVSSKSVNSVNFSFALVPLISARIINWQRERLNIKTDLIRNLYLIEGFLMVLFALYHGLPRQFVTLSWTVAALFYFMLSFVLRNIKYRYMALGTMISAAIYLFIVDLARIEIIYRVLALLFLAIVSIGISIFYSNKFNKSVKNHNISG